MRQIRLIGVNLNRRAHFRRRVEIRTRFETFRGDVDFVRRPSNVIVADAIVSVGVNVTQTDLFPCRSIGAGGEGKTTNLFAQGETVGARGDEAAELTVPIDRLAAPRPNTMTRTMNGERQREFYQGSTSML